MAMPVIHNITEGLNRITHRVCLDIVGRDPRDQQQFASSVYQGVKQGRRLYDLLRVAVLNNRFVTRYPVEYLRETLRVRLSMDKETLKEISGRSVKGKREYIMLLAHALGVDSDMEEIKKSDDPRLDPDHVVEEVVEPVAVVEKPAHQPLLDANLPEDVVMVFRHIIEENSAPFYDAVIDEPIDEKLRIRYERAVGMVKAYGSRHGVIHFMRSFKEDMDVPALKQLCEALSIIYKVDRDTIKRGGKIGEISAQDSAELLLANALTAKASIHFDTPVEEAKPRPDLAEFAQYIATMVYNTWMSQDEANSIASDYLKTK